MADKLKIGVSELKRFDKLPQRVKELFFYFLNANSWFAGAYSVNDFDYSSLKSPMEILFKFAFDYSFFGQYKGNTSIITLVPQSKITARGNVYFADFEVILQDMDKETSTKILIEIDGHDFHEKTKQQVSHDKERELDMKIAGYDIIRFSGSHVWNDPIKCANDAILYIKTKVGK